MILHQLILFAAGVGFGIICRLAYIAVTAVEKKVNLRAVTIIFDILMTGAGVIAFTLLLFVLNNGKFMFFIFLSAITGFILSSIIK